MPFLKSSKYTNINKTKIFLVLCLNGTKIFHFPLTRVTLLFKFVLSLFSSVNLGIDFGSSRLPFKNLIKNVTTSSLYFFFQLKERKSLKQLFMHLFFFWTQLLLVFIWQLFDLYSPSFSSNPKLRCLSLIL